MNIKNYQYNYILRYDFFIALVYTTFTAVKLKPEKNSGLHIFFRCLKGIWSFIYSFV